MIAPTATCAVAISAALLLQTVHAPRVNWSKNITTHQIDNPERTGTREAFWTCRIRVANVITPTPINTARKRCAIRGRKIEDRQILVLMAHGRAKRQLHINQRRCHDGELFDTAKALMNLTV